jgi:flagellar motor switch/type III secretory pathway protein FliN
VAAWVGAKAAGDVAWSSAAVVDAADARQRISDPSLARVPVRRGELVGIVAVPWRAWRALASATLGASLDVELAAPRPPTIAERAFTAAAVAEVLVRADVAGEVELSDELPAWRGPVLVVELAIRAPVDAVVTVALPAVMPPPAPRPLAALVASRGARLPDVGASVTVARGRVAGWRDLVVRDVVVVGRPAAALLVGRGAIAVALDATRSRVTVLEPYQRSVMSSEELATDLDLPLAIVAGDVTMSARALLELTPGQVLSLGRSLGGPVELRAGGRCLARGELVEVDGELGVRITELVDAAPAVVATRP